MTIYQSALSMGSSSVKHKTVMITLLRTMPDPRNTLSAARQHMLQPYNDSFFFERERSL
jgi:hypothetical protein